MVTYTYGLLYEGDALIGVQLWAMVIVLVLVLLFYPALIDLVRQAQSVQGYNAGLTSGASLRINNALDGSRTDHYGPGYSGSQPWDNPRNWTNPEGFLGGPEAPVFYNGDDYSKSHESVAAHMHDGHASGTWDRKPAVAPPKAATKTGAHTDDVLLKSMAGK